MAEASDNSRETAGIEKNDRPADPSWHSPRNWLGKVVPKTCGAATLDKEPMDKQLVDGAPDT